jgi:hypothetical protein
MFLPDDLEPVGEPVMVIRRCCAIAFLVCLGLVASLCDPPASRAQEPIPNVNVERVPEDPLPEQQPKEVEQAIAKGLEWLALHQAPDGHWGLHDFNKHARTKPLPEGQVLGDKCDPGTPRQNDTVGTALALLPFLAAGHTHKPGKGAVDYSKTVSAGLQWLIKKQGKDGAMGGEMYTQAIATFALCEAFGMTSDPILKPAAQKSLDYIVAAQHEAGGWRYSPKQAGDLSVTGWQMTALKSGQMAGLKVPPETFKKAEKFLDSCQTRDGGYSYMPDQGLATPTMTAVGMLCRQYLGANPRNPQLLKGTVILEKSPPGATKDSYYEFYATRVMLQMGGASWEFWSKGPDGKNGIREVLVKSQLKEQGARPAHAGSWDPPQGAANSGGRIMATSLALLMLEMQPTRLPRELPPERP